MSDIVQTGTLTVKYHIRDRGDRYGKYRYDWVAAGGSESDTYFSTVEEAVIDVEAHNQ